MSTNQELINEIHTSLTFALDRTRELEDQLPDEPAPPDDEWTRLDGPVDALRPNDDDKFDLNGFRVGRIIIDPGITAHFRYGHIGGPDTDIAIKLPDTHQGLAEAVYVNNCTVSAKDYNVFGATRYFDGCDSTFDSHTGKESCIRLHGPNEVGRGHVHLLNAYVSHPHHTGLVRDDINGNQTYMVKSAVRIYGYSEIVLDGATLRGGSNILGGPDSGPAGENWIARNISCHGTIIHHISTHGPALALRNGANAGIHQCEIQSSGYPQDRIIEVGGTNQTNQTTDGMYTAFTNATFTDNIVEHVEPFPWQPDMTP